MNDRRCLRNLLLILTFVSSSFALLHATETPEVARWEREAANVTIVRDDRGIAHVYGKTDADAVFGMEYAQAEDDFNRVETNYINAMGRLAEAEGESKIYLDLRMKLFIDPVALKREYAESPVWLRALMDSFADGLNFYLYKHPEVKPRVIKHFEPWMALSFTEGSIGGDIERVNLKQLEEFYSRAPAIQAGIHTAAPIQTAYIHDSDPPEPTGSNGMAIAPSNTAGHHALLLINPHTSFFFRSELQMASDQGLDAYGAVTWGQFFVYQGFNEHAGWMHTSSGVDAVDEYLETVEKRGDRFFYKYGSEEHLFLSKQVTVPYTNRPRHGRKGVHRLLQPPRTDHPRAKWQVGQYPPDAGANQGADSVLLPHQGKGLQIVSSNIGVQSKFFEQHHIRRLCRRHRLLPWQLHPAPRPLLRLHEAR